jgi:predicted TIM-barrel fold metal-dependent hydrolase
MLIDTHHHYLPKKYFDEIETYLPPTISVRRDGDVLIFVRRDDNFTILRIDPHLWSDAESQLKALDASDITHAIVSASCFQDWMTPEGARVCNDGTAELVKRYPDRFSGMISVPPDGGDDMIREIRRARNELGLCAINITNTHKDRFPDHQDFRLLLSTAADLDIPVCVHPSWYGPILTYLDKWGLERSVGKSSDMNLAIARLLFSGVFNEFPNLRMQFSHLGGSLPITLRRLFFGPPGWLSAPDFDYKTLLKRVFVDTAPGMWLSSTEVEFTAKILGADQLMLGSDYPLSNDPTGVIRLSVDHVRLSELKQHEKDKINYRNAIGFFGLQKLERSNAQS